jgi:hypothetical protein
MDVQQILDFFRRQFKLLRKMRNPRQRLPL